MGFDLVGYKSLSSFVFTNAMILDCNLFNELLLMPYQLLHMGRIRYQMKRSQNSLRVE